MTEKSPKPHNFCLFNFFITQKAPRNGPLLLGSHWLLKFSFNFFSVIFCSLHVEEKTGTKMKKECGAGWRRGPWQRHPRHSPLPANPAPTQWYVLTRCHGMPATCKMPPARSPHNAQECPKIAHTVPWHAGNPPAPQCPRVPHNCANTHPGSHAWRFPHAGAAHCTSTE